jgi:hypothetical protein
MVCIINIQNARAIWDEPFQKALPLTYFRIFTYLPKLITYTHLFILGLPTHLSCNRLLIIA